MDVLEMIYGTPAGKFVAGKLGVSEPPALRRGRTMPTGEVLLGELDGGGIARETLALLGVTPGEPLLDVADNRTKDEKGRAQAPRYPQRPGALVVDATGLREITQLEGLRQLLRPVMRGLEPSGRVILLATDASEVEGLEAKTVAQAIDGINRTVGKELRGGATSNLVFLRGGASASDLASTMSFLLEGRSAFVSGQAWRVGPAKIAHDVTDRPFADRIVVVTGAARGIGAAIARTFARDGALVVAVDIPGAGDALAKVANEVHGSALQLDITVPDAGARIAAHVASRYPGREIWAVVHNAGITRDRMLANLDEKLWGSVLDVNLAAEMRINEYLLNNDVPGGLSEEARIVGIASTSGVAGNKGQTNYAASKAGVMGLVWAMRDELKDRPITTNAVAPGFIETEMTAAIPFLQREIFRRTNSLSQGGQPVDVAETLAYLCGPASGGVDGQVIRVCGQNLVGA
ncbi:3-oxoacyl-ACP reductase [Tessaracoccus sp. ZS01]|uniref:3-oxoacyl-ACP reductase n=1 Tax=Tessaracoccus sp. ZS01 TaxID=1906324 RepID=UPI00096DEB49|nr:3-oxoacyl-ACP reductase [Tessaracoccus sp. ZS01]MCG6567810.1 3-oxoacyl-ACP reductase [Tessaracoccus sp. ZS01]OMG55544.1 3-oxoacyl-ACP reductase [Tessaracoccus sp. ZS01]